MDRDHTPPPRYSWAPASATSSWASTRTSFHGGSTTSTSSALLGLSSSAGYTQRRFSSSLYPPPAPSSSSRGRFTPRGSYSGSGSGALPSRFRGIPPSSSRPPRPRALSSYDDERLRTLPSPFLSELSSIRRMGARIFGELEGPAASMPAAPAGPSSSTTPHFTPLPTGGSSRFAPPPAASQQQQAHLTPPPSGSFSSRFSPPATLQHHAQPSSPDPTPRTSGSFSSFFSPPATLQHQAEPSSADLTPQTSGSISSWFLPPASPQHLAQLSSADLTPQPTGSFSYPGFSLADLSPLTSGSFSGSGITPPATPQQQLLPPTTSDLPPLPCENFSNNFAPPASQQQQAPWHGETSLLGSLSSCSADPTPHGDSDTQPSSFSEEHPLPAIPEMEWAWADDLPPISPQPSPSATFSEPGTGFEQLPPLDFSIYDYELPELPPSPPQIPSPLPVIKQEPADYTPCLEPELITLDDHDDDDDDGGLSALLQSMDDSSSHEPASLLPTLQPSSSEDMMLEFGGNNGSGSSSWAPVESNGQSWAAMPTPASMCGMVSTSSTPLNFHSSMSVSQQQQQQQQQQAPPLGQPSSWSSDLLPCGGQPSSQMETFSGIMQPSSSVLPVVINSTTSTDRVQLGASCGSSGWGAAESSGGHGWMPMPALANKFNMTNIGGSGGSAEGSTNSGQNWPATSQSSASNHGMMSVGASSSNNGGVSLPWNNCGSSHYHRTPHQNRHNRT